MCSLSFSILLHCKLVGALSLTPTKRHIHTHIHTIRQALRCACVRNTFHFGAAGVKTNFSFFLFFSFCWMRKMSISTVIANILRIFFNRHSSRVTQPLETEKRKNKMMENLAASFHYISLKTHDAATPLFRFTLPFSSVENPSPPAVSQLLALCKNVAVAQKSNDKK